MTVPPGMAKSTRAGAGDVVDASFETWSTGGLAVRGPATCAHTGAGSRPAVRHRHEGWAHGLRPGCLFGPLRPGDLEIVAGGAVPGHPPAPGAVASGAADGGTGGRPAPGRRVRGARGGGRHRGGG